VQAFNIKRIALLGVGAQERYPERFASSLMRLHEVFKGYGAEPMFLIGIPD
jgi:flavodoxin I